VNTEPIAAGSTKGYTLIELVVVMAVIGATFYMVLPRLSAALIADPLRETAGYVSQTAADLRARAMASQQRQMLWVDLDNNRLFTGAQTSDQTLARQSLPQKAFGLGEDLRLAGLRFPRQQRATGGTVPVCFHHQGHSDQVIIHLSRVDGRGFSLYINPFLPGIEVYPGHIDYADLLETEQ